MRSLPKARREKLVIRELADELLVYDKERHEAHCLNNMAALVWNECDGRTTVAEIGRRVGSAAGYAGPLDERLVWYSLEQFETAHLLEERTELPAALRGVRERVHNRRSAIQILGLTAVGALPLVTSMIAPTSAQAATCRSAGAACTSSAQCCSGLCNTGTCT